MLAARTSVYIDATWRRQSASSSASASFIAHNGTLPASAACYSNVRCGTVAASSLIVRVMVDHAPDHSGDAASIAFDRLQARLLPLADVVMVLLLSRPPSGTLRTTRVTVVTIVLAGLVGAASLALIPVLALRVAGGHTALWLVLVPALIAAAVGCADLATFGMRQRYLLRARTTL